MPSRLIRHPGGPPAIARAKSALRVRRVFAGEKKQWWRIIARIEEAFMQLTPLERGMYALAAVRRKNGKNSDGKVIWTDGMLLKVYATAIGGNPAAIQPDLCAAEVFEKSARAFFPPSDFLDRNRHLAKIHAAPEPCWPTLVKRMLEGKWTEAETTAAVKLVRAVKPPRGYEALFAVEKLQLMAANSSERGVHPNDGAQFCAEHQALFLVHRSRYQTLLK